MSAVGLTRPARAGSYAAEPMDALLREHAGMVRRLAQQVGSRLPTSVDRDDLVQEGMLGLLDAARRWQPQANGAPFVVYARMRARGAMYDWLRRQDWVPRHQRDRLSAAQEAVTELTQSLGRAPDDTEVAQALGLSGEAYRDLQATDVSISLGDELLPADEPEADERSDPMAQAALREAGERLLPLLPLLPPKEQQVLALHYTEHLSYREIAYVMDLTPGRISQLHTEAMKRLRAGMAGQKPAPAGR